MLLLATSSASALAARREQQSLTPAPQQGKVHISHIHVGKAGGDAIANVLKRGQEDGSLKCMQNYCEIHQIAPQDKDFQGADVFLVTLRAPVARIVSAFNWRHPNGGSGDPWMGGVPKPGNDKCEQEEIDMYACFDEVDAFSDALDHNGTCGVTARRALTQPSKGHGRPVGHLGRGLSFYVRDVLDQLATKRVYAIRMEHAQADMECFLSKELSNVNASAFLEHMHDQVHPEYPRHNHTYLNATSEAKLRSALANHTEDAPNDFWTTNRILNLSQCHENAVMPPGESEYNALAPSYTGGNTRSAGARRRRGGRRSGGASR